MYKLVLVIVCLVTFSYQAELSDETKKQLEEYHQLCLKESEVSEEVLKKARHGEFEDDPKLKEHFFCLSKKANFQDDKGEIKTDVVKEKLSAVLEDEKKVDDVLSKCAVEKETPQETAYQSMKCYYEATHII